MNPRLKNTFITLILSIHTIICFAQEIRIPLPEVQKAITSIAMLPDSSILIAGIQEEIPLVVRYSYLDDVWQATPNNLTETLNRLSNSHMHFHFSSDFSSVVVLTTEGKTEKSYLIKQKNNGTWGLPVEILKSLRGEYNHATPAISNDMQYAYTTAYGIMANHFVKYNIEKPESYVSYPIDELSSIKRILPITDESFLVLAENNNQKIKTYYYLKLMEAGNFSAPLSINELQQTQNEMISELAITPFSGWVIYVKEANQEAYLSKLPSIIAENWNDRAEPIAANQADLQNKVKAKYVNPEGQFHALLIGNEAYEEKGLDLNQPRQDVYKLKEILNKYYAFDEQNIHTLINAKRSDIFEALYALRNKLSDKDNLLIFYAGHGYWDKEVQQGYWWPVDAKKDSPANWLSNSDLREQIRGISTAHTLLISDACFSGGIFKTRGVKDLREATTDIQLLYRMPSRRAISSGTLSTVPDNSVFFKYLSKYLIENEQTYLPSTELFTTVRKSVLSNSLTVPQDGVIMDSGDEGGDFIFIKKSKQ